MQTQMQSSMALKCQLPCCCSLSSCLACEYSNCRLQIPISRPKSLACESDALSPFGWPTFMSISGTNKALNLMRLSPLPAPQPLLPLKTEKPGENREIGQNIQSRRKNQTKTQAKTGRGAVSSRLQLQLSCFSNGSLPAFKRSNIYKAKNVMLTRWRPL